jgi:hypothetical protein
MWIRAPIKQFLTADFVKKCLFSPGHEPIFENQTASHSIGQHTAAAENYKEQTKKSVLLGYTVQ